MGVDRCMIAESAPTPLGIRRCLAEAVVSRPGVFFLAMALLLAVWAWLAQGFVRAAIGGAAIYAYFIASLTISRYLHYRRAAAPTK